MDVCLKGDAAPNTASSDSIAGPQTRSLWRGKIEQSIYVFIVIALRCLRFEPLWVILSGTTAAIGWIILIIYAIREAPTNPITWDYVTYMSSSKIHLGGEFDKVLSIIMVTIILSLVLVRARRLLVRATAELKQQMICHNFLILILQNASPIQMSEHEQALVN